MSDASVTVQDCGCIALPEDITNSLGMTPGSMLKLTVDDASRSVTLTATGPSFSSPTALAACPIKS